MWRTRESEVVKKSWITTVYSVYLVVHNLSGSYILVDLNGYLLLFLVSTSNWTYQLGWTWVNHQGYIYIIIQVYILYNWGLSVFINGIEPSMVYYIIYIYLDNSYDNIMNHKAYILNISGHGPQMGKYMGNGRYSMLYPILFYGTSLWSSIPQ